MKEISLTKGLKVLVDDSDFEHLNQFKWYALKPTGNNNYYAARGTYDPETKKRSTQYMHKVLMDGAKHVDHIDRNTLNNQRSNLRSVTASQNRINSSPKGTSKYMGVSWSKSSNKWQATINFNGKKRYLGAYVDEKQAAKVYNVWAKTFHKEFANLNVID